MTNQPNEFDQEVMSSDFDISIEDCTTADQFASVGIKIVVGITMTILASAVANEISHRAEKKIVDRRTDILKEEYVQWEEALNNIE